jgi:nitroreductase
MDVFEAIGSRHSYRGGFQDKPIPRETLRKIVEAGLKAPSGRNMQTTQFVIVDDPGIVGEIRSMHLKSKSMQQAAACIACIVDNKTDAAVGGISFLAEDCSAAVENMLLAITALGLATVWIDGWLRLEGRAEKIGDLLGIPRGMIVRVILPIGIPTEECTGPEKKPFEARAWFNKYGG